MASLTSEDIKTLSKPFPDDCIGVKVQSLSKDKTKAMLVLYVSHTDVYTRLEEVDPSWECTVTKEWGGAESYFVAMKLIVKGVSRENVGEGNDPKVAYSDALKRAAMLFGVGRLFYEAELVWVPYTESRDKYKKWTLNEYWHSAKGTRPPDNSKSGQSALSTYVAPTGPFKGVALKDLLRDDLFTFWRDATQLAKTSGKTLSPSWLELLVNIEQYLEDTKEG